MKGCIKVSKEKNAEHINHYLFQAFSVYRAERMYYILYILYLVNKSSSFLSATCYSSALTWFRHHVQESTNCHDVAFDASYRPFVSFNPKYNLNGKRYTQTYNINVWYVFFYLKRTIIQFSRLSISWRLRVRLRAQSFSTSVCLLGAEWQLAALFSLFLQEWRCFLLSEWYRLHEHKAFSPCYAPPPPWPGLFNAKDWTLLLLHSLTARLAC